MKNNIRQSIAIVVSYLYALLFMYAAFSKLFEYEQFRVQLGQSPLLSAFATPVSIAVPALEIVIAVMLVYDRLRFFGLFLGYGLMAMFTAYIYIILNYSAFVPCSCGGILEKMTWNQHLLFNLVFVLMALIAILVLPVEDARLLKKAHP